MPDLRPTVDALLEAATRLAASGQPFETSQEDVLGERMAVYTHRPRSLREVLKASAAHGDRDCLVFDDGRRISFTQFERDVASVAAGLAARGIGKGDRVAICAANGPGWLLTFWAATSMGAVVVAMNGWWTALEMRHALELTEPKLLVADAKRLQRIEAPGLPVVDLDTDFDALWHHDPEAGLPDVAIDEDDAAMLLFTSGTTGRPKAAVQTHRTVIAFTMSQSFIAARAMLLAGRDATAAPAPRLAVFPLFHVSGLGTTVSGLLTGGTTVWPLGRFDAGRVIELTKEHGIAAWGGTSTHVLRLLEHPDLDTLDPLSIQQVGIGGSASTPDLIRRTEEKFPHLKGTFSTGYGSTESGGLISYATNAMITAVPECVGPPLPTIEVRVVDDEGNDVPEGDEGNICARSPLVMKEYWRHPEANAEAFLPGRWLKTGDFGRFEGGALFLASRKRDLIIRGGENIYPFEIENRLEEHPEIDETAVFGVDHPMLGQEVKAVVVVVSDSTLTAEAVQGWCAETLSSYKVPAHVELRTEALPRNATGKIMKHVLAGEAENTFVEE
ncbi:MAG: acyl-CoA synthetase (AMP-forming)/AMP-acid ligase [Acidimicrobiales bacterium]|nr:acyl-CoA synthetase (AMP-forming)/AMP-acid ligase [Acidimicrobiales bacterium]